MLIHQEGKKILLNALLILLLINAAMMIFFPKCLAAYIVLSISIVLYLLMLNFYRKPKRTYKGKLMGSVNAPTDGKVVVIEKVMEKEFFNEERIQISIFMSFFNAHSNWIPVTGKIIHAEHVNGRFHAAYLPKSSAENEHSNVIVETPDGHKILTKQIAGAVARRIVTYVKKGDQCMIGDPLGFIKLGSRMDIFLPVDSEILINLGDQVRANKTFIAHLPGYNENKQESERE